MKSFGKTITEIRKARNMSQAELVRLMNEHGIPMKVAALSKWEQDATRPNVLQFFTFCEIMGIKNINSVFHVADQDNHYSALNEEGSAELTNIQNCYLRVENIKSEKLLLFHSNVHCQNIFFRHLPAVDPFLTATITKILKLVMKFPKMLISVLLSPVTVWNRNT